MKYEVDVCKGEGEVGKSGRRDRRWKISEFRVCLLWTAPMLIFNAHSLFIFDRIGNIVWNICINLW